MLMMLLEGEQGSNALDLCWLFIAGANIMHISKKSIALISVYTISVESCECILQKIYAR